MGWCSGTEIFDGVCEAMFSESADKEKVLKAVIQRLWKGDWDCEFDSDYIKHPLVRKCFIDLDGDFKEYYRDLEELGV